MGTKKPNVNAGWVEVLFRKTEEEFHTLSEIEPDDYGLACGPVPIKELNRIFDVYVMLHSGAFAGIPRPVAHGDIVNVRITSPVNAIRTYILWEPELPKQTLVGGSHRLEREPGYPLGMVVLPHKFHSFWEKNHFLCPPFPSSKPSPPEAALPAAESSPPEAAPESVSSPEVFRKLKELAQKCGFDDVAAFAAAAKAIHSEFVVNVEGRTVQRNTVRGTVHNIEKFRELLGKYGKHAKVGATSLQGVKKNKKPIRLKKKARK